MADNRQIAADVLKAVGGDGNVTQVAHCMTRLRFVLKDNTIANDNEVKKIQGVLGVARSGGQYQVIIGQNVPKVYRELQELGNFKSEGVKEQEKAKEKWTLKRIGNNILNYMAGSLTPMIPLLMAACLFRAVNAVLGPEMLGFYDMTDHVYILFDFMYDAGFYFFPVYLGYMAAKKLNATPILGAYLGGILIAPDFAAMVTNQQQLKILGINVSMLNYAQTVLPIILAVFAMSGIEKFLKKVMPEILSTIFTPFLTMMITAPAALLFLAPLGDKLGVYICNGLIAFGEFGGFIAVAVVAALWEFLVLGGMHTVLGLMIISILTEQGSVDGILTSGSFATFAVFGVALGAAFRLKDKTEKSTALGFFAGGFLGGVTEPTLYGLCFKYKRTFIGLAAGGLISGAYAGITGVRMYTFAGTSVLSVLGYAGGSTANLINACIACALAMLSAAVITFLFGFSKEDLTMSDPENKTSSGKAEYPDIEDETEIKSCISGRAISYTQIKDEVFSTGMMGKGVGIIPKEGVIVAPCDAEIVTVMEDTKHAVGLKLVNGMELLIHEGLDTVGLAGEDFELFVSEGDKVKTGDKLIAFDKPFLESKGLDTVTIFMLTNSDEYADAVFVSDIDAEAAKTTVLKVSCGGRRL